MTGSFTGNIVVELTDNPDDPYKVREVLEFHSGHPDSGLLIRCDVGFEFNGTSMPWGLRWLINPGDRKLLQCSAIHDRGFRDGYLIMRPVAGGPETQVAVHRDMINALMAEAMVAAKVVKWKRVVINTGLALGSGPTWRYYRDKYNALRTPTTE